MKQQVLNHSRKSNVLKIADRKPSHLKLVTAQDLDQALVELERSLTAIQAIQAQKAVCF